jgi:hypothetical protein
MRTRSSAALLHICRGGPCNQSHAVVKTWGGDVQWWLSACALSGLPALRMLLRSSRKPSWMI